MGEGKGEIRVAVDVEGVLADNNTPFVEDFNQFFGLSGEDAFTVEDITSWGFGAVSDYFEEQYADAGYGMTEFMNGVPEDGEFPGFHPLVASYWEEDPGRLEPMAEHLGDCLLELREVLSEEYGAVQIDIVTARGEDDNNPHLAQPIKEWLHDHGVTDGADGTEQVYDEFRMETDKHELDYDLFVDDNPHLYEELDDAVQVMPETPWNTAVDDALYETVVKTAGIRSTPQTVEELYA